MEVFSFIITSEDKYTFFYKKKVYKKMRLKKPKFQENVKKITRLKFHSSSFLCSRN